MKDKSHSGLLYTTVIPQNGEHLDQFSVDYHQGTVYGAELQLHMDLTNVHTATERTPYSCL